MHYSPLPDRAVLAVSGDDARSFLQGLVTKAMDKVTENHAVFAALLSPQGRFLYDFFISQHENRLLLETNKERLADLLKRLKMYRLRSKVEFTELPEFSVYAVWGGDTPQKESEIRYSDPRLPELGVRILAKEPYAHGEQGDYDLHRLSLGVPEGSKDLAVDRSILLEYGYDELHGVDFDKGCYVGQEVTARSKHRASLRKFIHTVQAGNVLPPSGTPVLAGEREAGEMRSSNGTRGLAHLKVEEVARAAREKLPLIAAGITLTATLPGWCRTVFQSETA